MVEALVTNDRISERLLDYAEHRDDCNLLLAGVAGEEQTLAVIRPCSCGLEELRQQVVAANLSRAFEIEHLTTALDAAKKVIADLRDEDGRLREELRGIMLAAHDNPTRMRQMACEALGQPAEPKEDPGYTALHYVGKGPLPDCDSCGHPAAQHDPPFSGRCPQSRTGDA